jgi:hypothetical protein
VFVGDVERGPNNLEFAVAGASVYQNKTDVTSYSYDSVKREFVSYDTPSIAKMKALYAVNKGLAGTMFWEVYITFNCCVHQMTDPIPPSSPKIRSAVNLWFHPPPRFSDPSIQPRTTSSKGAFNFLNFGDTNDLLAGMQAVNGTMSVTI